LFIEINNKGCFCGLYDRVNQVFVEEANFEIDADLVDKIAQFFEPFSSQINADDYDLASFLPIGVKGVSFYKISHGREFFTQEEIQACLDSNSVVFRKYTRQNPRTSHAEYDAFEKAKKGDLFYLCWGSHQFLLIGQFIDNDLPHAYEMMIKSGGWVARKYRIIRQVQLDRLRRLTTHLNGLHRAVTPVVNRHEIANRIRVACRD
jgi:hypothetical protein